MAISRVQSAKVNAAAASASVTWSGSTVTGNFLVAVVAAHRNGGGFTLAAPGGWTLAGLQVDNSPLSVAIFYSENTASQASTGNFSFASGVNNGIAIVAAEYSGIAAATSLDKTISTSTGATASPDSGTTATTTQAVELWIAAWGQMSDGVFSAPTNSFAIVDQNSNQSAAGFGELIAAATGAAGSIVTSTQTTTWAGAVATFKGATATASTGPGQSGFPADQNDPALTGIPALAAIQQQITRGRAGSRYRGSMRH